MNRILLFGFVCFLVLGVRTPCAGAAGQVQAAGASRFRRTDVSTFTGTDPESTYGATNINAETGNGGLSAGISKHGTITVLRWPSPSYYDQLNYKTATQGLTLSSSARTLPHFGAADNMGSFAGISFTAGMPVTGMVWLRDPAFTTQQLYVSPDADIVETQYTSAANGIKVVQYDLVLPGRDVLVRHYEITDIGTAPIGSMDFVYYENLAPCLKKTIYLPVDDWIDDSQNDYACVYDPVRNELVHFMPGDGDFSHVSTLFAGTPDQTSVEAFLSGIAGLPDGVYAVIGFDFTPDGYQVGSDATTLCPAGRGTAIASVPEDAYVAASSGTLPGSLAAQCQANAAVSRRFSLGVNGTQSFNVYFSFAKNYRTAKANLDYAMGFGWQSLFDSTETWWKQWLSAARLPDTTDQTVLNFVKRTLISIRLATDNSSGAIVASVSTQPPYAEDWPRDGSFINYALDVAGYHDMVTKHDLFYAQVQRKAVSSAGPAGSFDMNFYADGMPGGPIPFEIDETGLAVWTMWVHTSFLGSVCERVHYMQQVWPAIKLGTQALVDCKDASNGLQCYANEDDNVNQTQGLQGAITTWLGIESGIQAARYMGDGTDEQSWQARADELKGAILANFYTPATQYTNNTGAASWAIWPASFLTSDTTAFLPYTSPTMLDQGAHILSKITPDLTYQTPLFSYDGKSTVALALLYRNDPQDLAVLDPLIYSLLHNVPTRDTQHMGESYVVMLDTSGNPYYDDRVAQPHVWEQTLSYLTVMARYNPQDFYPPVNLAGPESCPSSAGCSCSTSPGGGSGDAVFLILAGVFLFLAVRIGRKKLGH